MTVASRGRQERGGSSRPHGRRRVLHVQRLRLFPGSARARETNTRTDHGESTPDLPSRRGTPRYPPAVTLVGFGLEHDLGPARGADHWGLCGPGTPVPRGGIPDRGKRCGFRACCQGHVLRLLFPDVYGRQPLDWPTAMAALRSTTAARRSRRSSSPGRDGGGGENRARAPSQRDMLRGRHVAWVSSGTCAWRLVHRDGTTCATQARAATATTLNMTGDAP
jgi:hypothetical protein